MSARIGLVLWLAAAAVCVGFVVADETVPPWVFAAVDHVKVGRHL